MSTYYYVVCDKHLERVDACSRSGGGIVALVDSDECLVPFIVTHCGCPVRIVSEQDEDSYNDLYKDWTAENMMEMYDMDRD